MRNILITLACLVVTVGCTRSPSSSQTGHADATARPTVPAPAASSVPVSASSVGEQGDKPAALASATSAPSSSAPVAAASASAVPEPLPNVEVKNIGMHIGGGPNDKRTKAPIAQSVKPHFDELRACWRHAQDQSKGGTFGVDLLIPRAGGKATPSHPRSAIKGEAFEKCVLDVFRGIDFKKPRTGKTMVSYSLRYTPGK